MKPSRDWPSLDDLAGDVEDGSLDFYWQGLIGDDRQLSVEEKTELAAGGEKARLVFEGYHIQDVLGEAKHGNTAPLYMLAAGIGAFEYRNRYKYTVRHVEKILAAYRRGSLVAGKWHRAAAAEKVMQEFGRSRHFVYGAIKDNKARGGVFAL